MRRIATLILTATVVLMTPVTTASADYEHCTRGLICFRSPGVDVTGVHDRRP